MMALCVNSRNSKLSQIILLMILPSGPQYGVPVAPCGVCCPNSLLRFKYAAWGVLLRRNMVHRDLLFLVNDDATHDPAIGTVEEMLARWVSGGQIIVRKVLGKERRLRTGLGIWVL